MSKQRDRKSDSELYMMANRSPWMVWRLKALDAGYVPPLLPGRIPPEMARIGIADEEEHYEPEQLARHARWFSVQQRNVIRRGFTAFLVGFLLTVSVLVLYLWKVGADYRFGLIDSLKPRVEQSQTLPKS